ncbi:hypothetical protein L798_00997 [Zootermopsis nevadensis]|uniref:Uncharacterized protein n=1 Tax=Zootermopsis nevadensis TaxID=136037 RepID=A0A067QJW1_ZOONE|nr:hypothetical protein L798_00997 [Zootermopsis nevadensis]
MFAEGFSERNGLTPTADCATVLEDGSIVSDPEPLARNTLREDLILGRLHAPDGPRVSRVRVGPGLLVLSAPVKSLRGGIAHSTVSRSKPLIPEK